MIKLCIFDLDGTVLNTLETIAYYVNSELEKNSIEPIELNDFRYIVGKGAKNLIETSLKFRKAYSEESFDKIYPSYMDEYKKNATYKTVPYDGIIELLNNLKNKGIKIAIVSNKPDIQAKLVINEIIGENVFDNITGQLEGYPTKPDPTLVFRTLEMFGVKKDECIYIGDTSTDMKTGKNADLFSVGVTWGFRDREELEENGADLIIDKPSELFDYIEKLN